MGHPSGQLEVPIRNPLTPCVRWLTLSGKAAMPAVRTTKCHKCHQDLSRKTVRHHLRIGCTQSQRKANRRKAAARQLDSPRRQPRPLHLRNPGSSPSPPRARSPRRTNNRRSNPANPAQPEPPRDHRPHAHSPSTRRSIQHPDFAFDTPGAGPSQPRALPQHQPDNEPAFQFYEDEWDDGVLLDSDSDDRRPEGPALCHNAPWLKGLAASDILKQELEAVIARNGGKFSFLFLVLVARLITK